MADGAICSVDGCSKPACKRGFCDAHYHQARYRGLLAPTQRAPRNAHITFLKSLLVNEQDGCVRWPFSRTKFGYAATKFHGKSINASRLMCIIAHGDPPTESHQAAHSCGNGHMGCVNPRHLRWATPSENALEKYSHGTMRVGERNGFAKLNSSQVKEIRRRLSLGEKGKDLASLFGVTPSTISVIKKRKAWK